MQNRVELHLHMDGSLSERTVNALVNKNYQVLTDDEKALWGKGELYNSISVSKCKDLNDYLKKFDLPCRLMQTPEAVELAFENLVIELVEQNILYAEIRFAPQLHSKNLDWQYKAGHEYQIVEAAIRGVEKGRCGRRIMVNLILCCMRNLPERYEGCLANERNIQLAEAFWGKGVCAIDLAGAEARDATSEFEQLFVAARRVGIPFTIHAGESGEQGWMRSSLEKAIEFGASRIGHGVGLKYFPELMRKVRGRGITIECCIKSNLDTKAVTSLEHHPAKWFYDSGLRVTLNTDNMTVSNTNLTNEYALAKSIGFTAKDIEKMQEYAMEAAFMTEFQRQQIKQWMNNPFLF